MFFNLESSRVLCWRNGIVSYPDWCVPILTNVYPLPDELSNLLVLQDGDEREEEVEVELEDEGGGKQHVDVLLLARHEPGEEDDGDGEGGDEEGYRSSVAVNFVLKKMTRDRFQKVKPF